MKAVIMAGGEGTRLRPLTSNQQKAMMPLVNKPMMEHIVQLLKEHGFEDIVVTVGFLANSIRTYFGDGSEFGVRMVYATEETPLGNAGSVRNAMDELDERFLVIASDVITDIDLSAVVKYHEEKGAMATIGLKSMENPLDFGIVITREDGSIERFLEKPTWGQVFSDTINTGIYVLEAEIFDYIPDGKPVDFSGEVFPALLAEGKPLFGFMCEGYWEDVGTLDAYWKAHQDVLDRKVDLDVPGFQLREGVWLGEGSEVDPTATIDGPAVIGDYCRIEAGAHIGEYSVLGNNIMVGPEAFVERSVVHDNAYLGATVRLRGSVIGRGCDLRQGARCEEGVVLGDECFVGDHAVVNSGVKVYPYKTVEAGAVINSSIVWESRGARHLFGRDGVAGLANVDISPELAVRLAMAYAATLKKGATGTVSRDSSRVARTLKRAIMVGLNTAGLNVDDLEMAPVPVTRFQVRSQRTMGGITVRLAADDAQSVVIRFFDANGLDIDEGTQRKIERLFYREDFRRAFAGDIGDIGFPPRAIEFYTAALMATVDAKAIQSAGFKIVLDYAYGSTSFVMPSVLAKTGAEVLALNPYASTAKAAEYDRAAHAQQVSDLVKAAGAHLGAVIEPGGERIVVVDDTGRVLSSSETLFSLVTLVSQTTEGARIALPVSTSLSVAAACEEGGGEVVWTKRSAPALMDAASAEGVSFAASDDGGFIFPSFLPAYDGTATLVHLLGLLAATGVRLSKVTGAAPRIAVAHERVATPWEMKGTVMRTVMEDAKGHETVLVDGVKVLLDDGWVLVLPDPEEPFTHVWAESSSEADSKALAEEWGGRIRRLVR
ncbi:MAG: sugar phosphate nucleotidyltransferase [Acidimicrobiales bacterium]